MNNDEEMRNFINFFENMLKQSTGIKVDIIPVLIGWCNCCFQKNSGYHLIYEYTDGQRVQLFICLICKGKCKPDEPCTLEGCSFIETHDKYVTNKNNKLPKR